MPSGSRRFEREARCSPRSTIPHRRDLRPRATDGRADARPRVWSWSRRGEDLAQRISRGPIPIDEALPIARQIAEALEAAHEQGIVHRDLKPANVKVPPDGTVKVLDFGLAKALDATPAAGRVGPVALPDARTRRRPQAGMILGTAAYMAPEQARGKAVDRRADIWAFGVVLFEMLTGKPGSSPARR